MKKGVYSSYTLFLYASLIEELRTQLAVNVNRRVARPTRSSSAWPAAEGSLKGGQSSYFI
jgi:hypothetical protein